MVPVIVPPANGKKTPAPGVSPSAYALVTKLAALTGVIPDTKPVKLPVPATSNLALGLVVPIPTFLLVLWWLTNKPISEELNAPVVIPIPLPAPGLCLIIPSPEALLPILKDVALTLPDTSNLLVGVIVPIPTLPVPVTTNL